MDAFQFGGKFAFLARTCRLKSGLGQPPPPYSNRTLTQAPTAAADWSACKTARSCATSVRRASSRNLTSINV